MKQLRIVGKNRYCRRTRKFEFKSVRVLVKTRLYQKIRKWEFENFGKIGFWKKKREDLNLDYGRKGYGENRNLCGI